jgi:MATE family multidrug resistance protein
MLLATPAVAVLLVPGAARPAFSSAWWVAALALPLNSLAFATDGVHWGTSDYRFLRDAMAVATGVGASLLFLLQGWDGFGLGTVWGVTAVWIGLRAGFGVTRIWPGFGAAPLRLT